MKLQSHLLQEDLIEDGLRDQGLLMLLMQTVPANQELLFSSNAFWDQWSVGEVIKGAFLTCFQHHLPSSQRAGRVGQQVLPGTGSSIPGSHYGGNGLIWAEVGKKRASWGDLEKFRRTYEFW